MPITDVYLRGGHYGGRNMVGSRPIPYNPVAENPGLGAFEAFQQNKRLRKADEKEDALYAQQMAELAGGYTPELERQALSPLDQEPSAIDRLMGGAGRMFGMDTERGMTEPFTVPGGLKTRYERDREAEELKYSREQSEALTKHLRAIEKDTLSKEKAYELKKKGVEESVVSQPLTKQDRIDIRKATGGAATLGLDKKIGGMAEKVKQALMNGKLKREDMTEEHFLVLGKDWAIKGPNKQAIDVFKMAQKIVEEAMKNMDIPEGVTPTEYQAQVADDINANIQALTDKIRVMGGGNGKGNGKRKSLDNIFNK